MPADPAPPEAMSEERLAALQQETPYWSRRDKLDALDEIRRLRSALAEAEKANEFLRHEQSRQRVDRERDLAYQRKLRGYVASLHGALGRDTHGNPKADYECAMGKVADLRVEELENGLGPPIIHCPEDRGPAHNGCSVCAEERDEPHTWEECVERLKAQHESILSAFLELLDLPPGWSRDGLVRNDGEEMLHVDQDGDVWTFQVTSPSETDGIVAEGTAPTMLAAIDAAENALAAKRAECAMEAMMPKRVSE